jgi:hypothetical protein
MEGLDLLKTHFAKEAYYYQPSNRMSLTDYSYFLRTRIDASKLTPEFVAQSYQVYRLLVRNRMTA